MGTNKNISDTKVCCNILQNKLRNLKEYDLKFGTNIIQSLSKNISSYDDVLSKSLSAVNLNGCGGEKYLAEEISSVTNIYNDLLTKIANNQNGCGDTHSAAPLNKDITNLKNNIMTIAGLKKPRGHSKNNSIFDSDVDTSMGAKRRSKSKKAASKTSKKSSKKKKASKTQFGSNNIIF